ncbi:MAG: hypothetical protein ACE5Q6_23365 [Dehalococcoidia bacterium]
MATEKDDRAEAWEEEVELVQTIPAVPVSLFTVGVAGTTGVCPVGYRNGRVWFVGHDGHISRPLCRPGVTAITSALQAWSGAGLEVDVSCLCPLGHREVTFALRGEG